MHAHDLIIPRSGVLTRPLSYIIKTKFESSLHIYTVDYELIWKSQLVGRCIKKILYLTCMVIWPVYHDQNQFLRFFQRLMVSFQNWKTHLDRDSKRHPEVPTPTLNDPPWYYYRNSLRLPRFWKPLPLGLIPRFTRRPRPFGVSLHKNLERKYIFLLRKVDFSPR